MLGFETRHGVAVPDGIWQNRAKFGVRRVLAREVRKTRRSCGDGECIDAIMFDRVAGSSWFCIVQPPGDVVARMMVGVT